jgi:hypothetical protein
MVVTVSSTTVPLPGSISSLFLETTSRKWRSASCTWRTWTWRSRRGFLSSCSAAVPRGSRGVLGEEGETALVAPALPPPPPTPPPGERICESFSRKSSLKERARRANLPPRAFPAGRSSTSVTQEPRLMSY